MMMKLDFFLDFCIISWNNELIQKVEYKIVTTSGEMVRGNNLFLAINKNDCCPWNNIWDYDVPIVYRTIREGKIIEILESNERNLI